MSPNIQNNIFLLTFNANGTLKRELNHHLGPHYPIRDDPSIHFHDTGKTSNHSIKHLCIPRRI